MKTLLKTVIGLCFYITMINAKEALSLGSEVKEYDKIFERIAERRVGADVIMLDKLENPFISITTDQQKSDGNETAQLMVYTLEATFDQKAKISGTWYKRNETVGAYKLAKITHNSVILQNEIEKKELVIRTKDESNVNIFSK
ncbi:hypothetical protein [Sulfurospirillum halorespirans]|uniref:Uncharacterized protein n=1 Tax=Sulfurospirillum halorespirans DSM 13726 TaxID=1193502 RepID=A0A1D7TJN9_9BACT|nr:hypothetical protein [Sulfurospirillum halorespirans]AOO65238.1 hypothetical protein SHALO_1463 [Sulfurospirillum halorespirans DSM 13726]